MPNKFIAFALGCVCGSVATYFMVKKPLEKRYEEETIELRNTYMKMTDDHKKILEEEIENFSEQYENTISELSYKSDTENDNNVEVLSSVPYMISEEEYSNVNGYEKISLNYYSEDDVLADDSDQVIRNVEETVGAYTLECLDNYDEETVFVRNEKLSTDYEVVRIERAFSDYIEEQ